MSICPLAHITVLSVSVWLPSLPHSIVPHTSKHLPLSLFLRRTSLLAWMITATDIIVMMVFEWQLIDSMWFSIFLTIKTGPLMMPSHRSYVLPSPVFTAIRGTIWDCCLLTIAQPSGTRMPYHSITTGVPFGNQLMKRSSNVSKPSDRGTSESWGKSPFLGNFPRKLVSSLTDCGFSHSWPMSTYLCNIGYPPCCMLLAIAAGGTSSPWWSDGFSSLEETWYRATASL